MAKSGLDKVVRHICRVTAEEHLRSQADGELLRAFIRRGDQDAFAMLVKRYGPLVLATCRRVLRRLEDAEDAFQATFIVLARQARALVKNECVGGWLHRVAHRLALDARRALERRAWHERQSTVMNPTNPEWEAAWREVQVLLDDEIQRLPGRYRDPFILCALGGQSCAAAAQRLGLKEGTVWSRLAEARKRLQARLSRRGVELTAVLGAAALGPGVATAQVGPALVAKAVSAATGAAVPASVSALVKGLTASLAIKKAKLCVALFIVFSGLVGTASMWAVQQESGEKEKPPQAVGKQEEAGKAEQAPAKDIYGDPMPPGAVARLGSVRFRHNSDPIAIAYAEQGKTLIVKTDLGFELFDAATGKKRQGLNRLPLGVGVTAGQMKFSANGKPARDSGPSFGNPYKYIAISPDGTILAIPEKTVANKDIVIGFWDLAANKKTHSLSVSVKDDPNAPKVPKTIDALKVQWLRFAPDDKHLVMAYTTRPFQGGRPLGRATVFDRVTGKTLVTFNNGEGPFDFLSVAPNGKMIATLGSEIPVRLLKTWDMFTGGVIHELKSSKSTQLPTGDDRVAFSADSKMLAFEGESGQIVIFDLVMGKEICRLGSPKKGRSLTVGLRFTDDGKNLVMCEQARIVHRWDLSTQQIVQTMNVPGPVRGGENGPLVFSFAPDLKTIAFGYVFGGRIHLWDLTTEKELFSEFQGNDEHIRQLSFLPTGRTVVSVNSFDRTYFWDLENKKHTEFLSGSHADLFFSNDGRRFATIHDGQIQIQNMPDAKKPVTMALPENALFETALFSTDSSKLFTLETQDPSVQKGRIQTRIVGKTVPVKRFVRHWDVVTGHEEAAWELLDQYKVAGVKEPILVLSSDGHAVFMQVDSAQEKKPASTRFLSSDVKVHFSVADASRLLRGREDEAGESMAPSPDSRMVASVFYSPAINLQSLVPPSNKKVTYGVRLWEVMTGKEIAVIKGQYKHPQDTVRAIAWSADGRLVACPDRAPALDDEHGIGSPFQILVLDSASGKEVGRYEGIDADIKALAFSPDSKYLAAGLGDTSIMLYDIGKIDPKYKPAPRLSKPDLEVRWAELGGASAKSAHQAIGALALAPNEAVPFLQAHLRSAPGVESSRIEKWLGDLNSDIFSVRQTAIQELELAAPQAQTAIKQALKRNPSLETRRRLEQILKSNVDNPPAEVVRTIRAIIALERIGSPDAQAVLQKLARGAPGARETEEAKASLERLSQRTSKVR